MPQTNEEGWSFRWGVSLLDEGYTIIPNRFLRAYSALGVSRTEMLFILHLASYHYESERGVARPSLVTVAAEMGYKDARNVQVMRKSLEEKKLLQVFPRPGQPSIYSMAPFARAAMREEVKEQEQEGAINYALTDDQDDMGGDQLITPTPDQLITQRIKERTQTRKSMIIRSSSDIPADLANAGPDVWEQVWALVLDAVRVQTAETAFAWFRPTHLQRVTQNGVGDLFVISHPTEYGCEALGGPRLMTILRRALHETITHPVTVQFVADGRWDLTI